MKEYIEVDTEGMDCTEYKKITGDSKVLNYKVIHDTLGVLEDRQDLVDELLDLLSSSKIPKPEKHNKKDTVETSYYLVGLEAPVKVEIFKELNFRKRKTDLVAEEPMSLDELAASWFKTIDEGDLI